MKKLNNKGYMLVEIILASVLAFSIAYYLINLTFKFKDISEDIFYSNTMLNTKINITKNIMNDLNKHQITSVACFNNPDANNKMAYIEINDNGTPEKIVIGKAVNSSFIEYGKITGTINSFSFINDNSYYKKSLTQTANYLEIGIPKCTISTDNKVLTLKFPITNIYSDDVYSINIIAEVNA